MAELLLENITKVYNKTNALSNVNIKVNDKEFLVIVGPSGCGKSTILRIIAGLEKPTNGNIYIDGKIINDIEPKERDIAMVFQSYALYPHMNVFENIAFGLRMRKYPKNEIEKRVHETARILEMDQYLHKVPRELSGGQRQRVALGRAIVRNPKIFLFDEPLSNLDANLRVQMRAEISKLHQKLKSTMIYVTHDQIEAMTMGEKIVVIKNGIIQQIDTPQSLYENPVNKFVAGFIGSPSMNFFSAEVIQENSKFFLRTENYKITLPSHKKDILLKYTNSKIIWGIRPNEMKIENKVGINSFQATLGLLERLGFESYGYCNTGKDSFIVRVDANKKYKLGEKVFVSINPEKIYLFDPVTEMSLKEV